LKPIATPPSPLPYARHWLRSSRAKLVQST
jgi:hypothetical protein